MKTLQNYINNTIDKGLWDGHIHMFDHTGYINQDLINTDYNCVCFADIVFKFENEYNDHRIIDLYDEFISKHYNYHKHILLATGNNADDIISVYQKHPDVIKGFGELKCYGEGVNGKLPYDDLNWIYPVLEFNTMNLPVYIHYDLNIADHQMQFETLLRNFPNIPIVLCHCGMCEDCNKDFVFEFVKEAQDNYDNLWIDISKHESCDFFLRNPNKLLQLDQNKIIIGTDINPILDYSVVIDDPYRYSVKCYDNVKRLRRLVDYTKNIKQLFKKDLHK